MEFKSGDEVQLKSGGPIMTVESLGNYLGETKARCVWFHQDKLQDAVFLPATLVKVEE